MYTILRYEPGFCAYFDAFTVEQAARIAQALSLPPDMVHGRGRTVTPEARLLAPLRDADVDDARQAEYQRKMSMLLGRGSD